MSCHLIDWPWQENTTPTATDAELDNTRKKVKEVRRSINVSLGFLFSYKKKQSGVFPGEHVCSYVSITGTNVGWLAPLTSLSHGVCGSGAG